MHRKLKVKYDLTFMRIQNKQKYKKIQTSKSTKLFHCREKLKASSVKSYLLLKGSFMNRWFWFRSCGNLGLVIPNK